MKEDEDRLTKRGYMDLKKVDSGGQANVYKARTREDREVAIKVTTVKVTSDAKLDEDLQRELVIGKNVRHPNLLRVYDIFRTHTKVYIVMDFMDQGTIGDYVRKKGPLCQWKVKAWFCPIARAVKYLHSHNVAHRDLKLDNVLLDKNHNPKVADFGFSCFVKHSRTTGEINLSTTWCGTLSHFSPQIICQVPYNPYLADIWTLGVMAFIMINQEYPFKAEWGAKVILQHQLSRNYHLQPSVLKRLTDPHLVPLINMLLEPEEKKRPHIWAVCAHPYFPSVHQEADQELRAAAKQQRDNVAGATDASK